MFAKLKNFKNFDLIFNSISDMVFLMSIDDEGVFRYVAANQVAIDILQFPMDFVGKSIDDIMSPFSAKVITDRYHQAIDAKEVVVYEEKIEFPLKDNSNEKRLGWVESRVTPVFNDNGECERIISITREITEQKNREKELQRVKEQFELIFNNVADAVFTFDKDGEYQTVNPSFAKMFGWSVEEVFNYPAMSILPKENDFSEIMNRLKNGEVIENHYSERKSKNGDIIHILSSYTPVMVDGKMTGGIAVYKNITKMDELKERLHESEERYRIIVESSNDLITVTDRQGQIIYASPSHQQILGLKPDFFIGKSFLSFVHQDDMSNVRSCMNRMIESGKSDEIEYRRLNKNGEIIWIQSHGGLVLNSDGNVEQIVFVSRDTSNRMKRESELKTMALYDELTGLPNRTLFNDCLETAMKETSRKGKPSALLLLDCDNFKHVNDSFGHDVGDEVIKEFARRIQVNVRNIDTVSRMGGDEFQVVLPDLNDKDTARKCCQLIVDAMKHPIVVGEESISITTSIGMSYYLEKGKTKETLIKEADKALYASKSKGKSTFSEYSDEVPNKSKVKFVKRLFKK
ncbi:PAS domain S-box protein [Aquibacillus halophilus]|uniref:PAS domain S-box protein n=1 Tax=Aquibacillus halophilus TaxID=930132 RepID=A0A6A8DDT1_9BACI|nr:sensor domain-containing diguanylate cyclase [Aquibacillus halophilus]MRH43855.1 PAS domain S-box protein [Aquibacillus halophilus]